MFLIVAEKPSQARAIGSALGINGKGDGCIAAKDVIISWCIGHLIELYSPEDYNANLKKWKLETLPFLPEVFKTKPYQQTIKQYNILKNLMLKKEVTEIICATDSGREGELIFDLVYKSIDSQKPVTRLWTSSLTPESIRAAYANRKPSLEYKGLRDAAHCRAQADWLVGINATRAQTLMAQNIGASGVWSVGRVQTPTLAILVKRELAIEAFVAKPFYLIEVMFNATNGPYPGKWFTLENDKLSHQISTKEKAAEIIARIKNKAAIIENLSVIEEKLKPEQLFDLTTLQKEANRKFSFTADKTLALTQSLYEKGILSYPRTGSRYLTPAEAEKLPHILKSLPALYLDYVKNIKLTTLSNRFVDASKVEDHHAIIPLGKCSTQDKEELEIFDLVARRTIAAYYPDNIMNKTTIITAIESDKFRTIGKTLVTIGWKAVEKRPPEKKEQSETQLPNVVKNEEVKLKKANIIESKTNPPKPFNDADILGAMETAGKSLEDATMREAMKDCGLGTPATRAAIIEGLVQREFVLRSGKNITPTKKGMALIKSLNSETLKSPELTGNWEAKLEEIRRGKLKPEIFMAEIKDYTKQIISEIKARHIEGIEAFIKPIQSMGKCPKCESDLILKTWQEKYYIKCLAINNHECKVSYDCDKTGNAKGGKCTKCQAPLKITKSKAKVCIACGTWG